MKKRNIPSYCRKEMRTAVYDSGLCMEAYCFNGIVRSFPNHFHEYYVFGLVEEGERILFCKNEKYQLKKGSILLFNPEDIHGCGQNDKRAFAYRCFNISRERMLELIEEITGKRKFLLFSQNIFYHAEIMCYFYSLHEKIMNGSSDFGKEEGMLFLISALIRNNGQFFETALPECRKQVEKACEFMREQFGGRINLEQLCRHAGLSKSTLLRAFIKEKGISPYRYLENVRVNEAKKLLEKGIAPADVACQTGFFDQSHFTRYFNTFVGISPGAYHRIFSGIGKGGGYGG